MESKQKAEQDDFLGRFRSAVEGQEKLPDIYGRVESKDNLPGLLDTAQRTSTQLQEMPETQKTATRGFNVNSNQLARIIGAETQKLAPIAQRAIDQFQQGSQLANQQMTFEIGQQNKDLLPFEQEASMLSERLAREFTGFTAARERELNSLLTMLRENNNLTISQMQMANQLAIQKLQYEEAKKGTSDLITLTAGQTVWNPSTGQAMYTAPYKPLTGSSSSSSPWTGA